MTDCVYSSFECNWREEKGREKRRDIAIIVMIIFITSNINTMEREQKKQKAERKEGEERKRKMKWEWSENGNKTSKKANEKSPNNPSQSWSPSSRVFLAIILNFYFQFKGNNPLHDNARIIIETYMKAIDCHHSSHTKRSSQVGYDQMLGRRLQHC